MNLIIEIKQSIDKPWVFFTTERSEFEDLLGFPIIKKHSGFSAPYHRINKIFNKYGTKLNQKIGRTYYEAMAANNKRDDIYKALAGTAKATSHVVDSIRDDQSSDRLFYFHEPVIIFNGRLFEAYMNEVKK